MDGLRSGHSGIDIHTGRGNAVQLLARLLFDCPVSYQLISLEGGSKHNVIPKEASASLIIDAKDRKDLESALTGLFKEICFEYKTVEKELRMDIQSLTSQESPMDKGSAVRFLSLLTGIPNGVMTMSQEIPGLVETSNNLAILTKNRRSNLLMPDLNVGSSE